MAKQSLSRLSKFLASKEIKESLKILRVLCGPLRFKIVIALNESKKGLMVTELSRVLGSSLSLVSHQLRILKSHRLVVAKKKNREVIYSLANHRIRKILSL